MSEVSIGGNRLGSGNKMKAHLRNFERSSHDLGYLWKSTMSSGTLVPFMSELALPGDTFDIDLDLDILTHPTIGPLFGNYKAQIDVFKVPIRLYNGMLHMNMLGIGMDMSKVLLPKMTVTGRGKQGMVAEQADNWHTNPSSILAYLGLRGFGFEELANEGTVTNRQCVAFLAYWDIYKNYYANKQEEIGVVVHAPTDSDRLLTQVVINGQTIDLVTPTTAGITAGAGQCEFIFTGVDPLLPELCMIFLSEDGVAPPVNTAVETLWDEYEILSDRIVFRKANATFASASWNAQSYIFVFNETRLTLQTFPLENIDTMRKDILQAPHENAFLVNDLSIAPYGLIGQVDPSDASNRSILYSQEGLGIKTYNSDLFNNWITTEWIDGADGISAITAVDTSGGSFTIDELNLSKKVYDMLNRIALSGGSYDDWLDAVYTHERERSAESPVYEGGMMQTLSFQEVISTANNLELDAQQEFVNGAPLGSLAGRGKLGQNKKGGKVVVKCDEPSYIIGIVSLTPNIDYSQGNKWDTQLLTFDDFHKPSLDQIGFQDLITDQMAWWDTGESAGLPVYKSAGKQPAWLNYMTNVNVTRGNFAILDNQMFMTLNRQYTWDNNTKAIQDLTTYIDPSKFNNIFADTALDAQNFWVQIAVNITARRKMSAKVIPNL